MDKPIVLEGVCYWWSEQGLNPCWAFQESKHIHPPTPEWPHERWDYAGLWALRDGDHLTIFNKKNPAKMVWSGFISLWQNKLNYTRQRGVNHKKWVRWFRKEYPAKFTPGPNQNRHPA